MVDDQYASMKAAINRNIITPHNICTLLRAASRKLSRNDILISVMAQLLRGLSVDRSRAEAQSALESATASIDAAVNRLSASAQTGIMDGKAA